MALASLILFFPYLDIIRSYLTKVIYVFNKTRGLKKLSLSLILMSISFTNFVVIDTISCRLHNDIVINNPMTSSSTLRRNEII